MIPALRIVAKKPPVVVARRSFGITTLTPGAFLSVSPAGVKHMDVLNTLLSSRLDWRFFSHNRGNSISITRP